MNKIIQRSSISSTI